MLNSAQSALLKSLSTALKPLVRVLLRFGIDYGTASEILRGVYVAEAFENAKKSGSRPTVSGVAASTGLTRKEVKRLNELPNIESGQTHERYNRAIRVISGWVNDKEFMDLQAQPAVLPMESDDCKSFADLVKRYSGDIPHAAMLSVLKSSGIVEELGGRNVKLLDKAYVPHNDPIDVIDILGVDTAELIATISHNMNAQQDQLVFQRKVSNALVRPEAVDAFKQLSFRRSQALLEELDSFLSAHEVEPTDEASASYVALGIYYFDDSLEDTKPGGNNANQ